MHTHITCFYCLLLFTICFASQTNAQHSCGFDHIHQDLLQQDSTYRQRLKVFEKKIQNKVKSYQSLNKSNEVYTIPVVVHVVYADKNADHNISDEQVLSGIQRLNDLFADVDATSVNANIEFCLASRTPDCQSTDGIVRVDASGLSRYATDGVDIESNDSDGVGASRIGMFNLSRWNTEEYLNIWVVNEISNNNAGSGVQAFATFPSTNYFYDGVVVLFNAFGYDYDNCNCYSLKSYTDENKILAHEIGHYLSLYHTFEGDAGGYSCPSTLDDKGDAVADTPAHIRTFNCLTSGNNCYSSNDPFYDIDKVIHNYMGYAPENCQNEFTQGQVDRMRACLETSRASLLYSSGCQPIVASEPTASCSPQTTQGINNEFGMGIISVKIGNLYAGSGSTYQDGGYVNNWCNSTSFDPNTQYEITITTYGYYNEDIQVFIDYDNNGTMDNGEMIYSSFNKSVHIGFFTTPNDAVLDTPLRLRIISDHYQYTINSSCYEPNYGQVEDYTVYLTKDGHPLIERGNALQLDGIDDCLHTDFSPDPSTQSFTYEFWCKPEGDPTQCQVIFDRTPANFSTNNFMAIWHGRIFVFLDKELLFMYAAPLIYGEWYHIAYTWDGASQSLYVNGILVGTDNVATVKKNNAGLNIGAFFNNHLFFEGQIDELRAWKEARTGIQIRENMHLTNKIINAEGLNYFHFNDSIQNSSIVDLSGTSNAYLTGNPTLMTSTVNTGGNGTNNTLTNIITNQVIKVNDVNVALVFTQLSDGTEFTVTKQEYNANTMEGVLGETIFADRTWTFCPSSKEPFNANITFEFSNNTFSEFDGSLYKLYSREVGSDGEWQLFTTGAAEVDASSITFKGVNQPGQYIVVK